MRLLTAALVLAAFAAPALAEVTAGDAAPDFTLKDQDGQEVKLSAFAAKKNVLLAFYPSDFSGGCTTQMKCFEKELKKVQDRDFVLLAISVDTVEKHAQFAKTIGARFRLLSDPDLAVAKAYGVAVPGSKGGYAARSVFVIDKQGKVRFLDRDLKVPQGTLDGTHLLAELDKVGGRPDPVAALAELPAAERDGKTVFVRFAQALLAEDLNKLDAVFDPEACARPGEAPQMQRDRRKALLDRYRALVEKNDLKSLRFEDVIDVPRSRVFTKEGATSAALTGFGSEVRDMALRLADGEMLVVGRTTAPKLGDVQVLAREVVMRVKKTGETWRIVEILS